MTPQDDDDEPPGSRAMGPDPLKDLPSRLEIIRQRLHLQDRDDVGRELGEPVTTYRSWANGSRRPDARKLIGIADKLGVNLVWLLTGRGEPFNPVLPDANRGLVWARNIDRDAVLDAPRLARQHEGDHYPIKHHSDTLFVMRVGKDELGPGVPENSLAFFDYQETKPANSNTFLIWAQDHGPLIRHYTDRNGPARWEPLTSGKGLLTLVADNGVRVLGRLLQARVIY